MGCPEDAWAERFDVDPEYDESGDWDPEYDDPRPVNEPDPDLAYDLHRDRCIARYGVPYVVGFEG